MEEVISALAWISRQVGRSTVLDESECAGLSLLLGCVGEKLERSVIKNAMMQGEGT